uniref:Reverse transcriptase domain-containing protein n=1 Tax=Tanacetum cinerariifolium TaxID=118510 RepID=A0A6L2M7Q6_TANCI|nr:hypothetical protein [Tanacetum cinerariifolium]
MAQNIDFSCSDQIQTPQYPEVHSPSQEMNEEVFQAREDLFNSNQEKEGPSQDFDIHQLNEECSIEVSEEQKQSMEDTMLELVKIYRQKELLCIHDNVDDLIESALNTKLLSINSQRLEKEKQEVKNVVEQPTKRGNRIEKSLQNFRVIHKSSISFKNTSQISLIHAVATILSTKEPDYSSSMGYENPNTTSETESDEIIKSGVEELVPILSENEVTLEDKRECDMLVCEDSSISDVCDNHSEIFSDSKDDDDISVYDNDFEDIDITRLIANIESLNDNPIPDCMFNSYVSIPIFEESNNYLSDNFSLEFETFCNHMEETRSGNTTHADNSLPEYDSFCSEIEPDQERLINVVKSNISDDSSNDPLLEEADLFLASDNSIPPGIENFADDSKGDIRFLEELLIDDSILSHESSDFNFEDNPSLPQPPPEQLDIESFFDSKPNVIAEEISNKLNEDECFDPGREINVSTKVEDDDYVPFMFVIRFFLLDLIFPKVSPFLPSAENEDTIFDPGISMIYPSETEVFLCWIFVSVSKIFPSFDLKLVWRSPYPLINIA